MVTKQAYVYLYVDWCIEALAILLTPLLGSQWWELLLLTPLLGSLGSVELGDL